MQAPLAPRKKSASRVAPPITPQPVARAKTSALAKSGPALTPDDAAPAAPTLADQGDGFDRSLHALQARYTLGLSPASLQFALADWWVHLAAAPGKRAALALLGSTKAAGWFATAARPADSTPDPGPAAPNPGADRMDRRFTGPDWQHLPFSLMRQAFLDQEAWWKQATTGVRGVSRHHEQVVSFIARQWLDLFAPTNFALTNPEVIKASLASGGGNFVEGAKLLQDDAWRMLNGAPPAGVENFVPGKQVAVTPGKVVLRNRLIELIQYSPVTPKVHAEPVLIVPAWIMKYYILDLSPSNSMVRYLVEQGHTVFMISWRNPGSEDRDLGMDDYSQLGPLAALAAVRDIVAGRKVHAVGYCLGGTLLAIAAALLAARGDETLASVTLLASQTDFTEPGELGLFIDESQVSFLEDMMWARGFLDTVQMAGSFQMLHSYDLIFSRMTRNYLLGRRDAPNDLMAWNADGTRMPYRMHAEYLRGLYLNNDLAEGRWKVGGRAVAIEDVRQPWFVVGTETDHVAPWRSVYKINLLADSDVTFVLTSGGHNAGIVSEPGHPHRHYRWGSRLGSEPFVDADQWLQLAAQEQGSWWPRWSAWLAAHSSGMVSAPRTGSATYPPVDDAPGQYVMQR